MRDDLVKRNFLAYEPNTLWLSDITERRETCLCAVKDVISGRIVGYSIDSRMKSRLAVTAVNNAVARRGDVVGCVLHTDRGSRFSESEVRAHVVFHGIAGLMGRVGVAGDIQAMGLSLLKHSVLDRRRWEPAYNLGSRSCPGPNAPATADADKPTPSIDADRTRNHHVPAARQAA